MIDTNANEVLIVGTYIWDTGSLSWIKNTGTGGGGGGGAATIADGADVAEGATTDAAVVTDTTGTVSGKLRGLVKWAFERMPASLGSNTSANSLPVVIASDQGAVPISGTVTATGPLTDVQLRASAVPVSLASTTITGSVAVTNANLDVALSTRLKAADTLAGVTTVGAVTSITNALPAGTNNIGDIDVLTLPIDTYSAKAVVASASGNNTIHTPTASNRIRLGYIVLSADGANSADVTATVKFAAGGSSLYVVSLKAGAMWARNVGAGRRYLDGGVNNALIVSLSTAQTVNVSIEYDESL